MGQTIALNKVVYDSDIYPCEKYNSHTVEVYKDALKAGAEFPPIILEEGTNHLEETI